MVFTEEISPKHNARVPLVSNQSMHRTTRISLALQALPTFVQLPLALVSVTARPATSNLCQVASQTGILIDIKVPFRVPCPPPENLPEALRQLQE